MSNCGENVTAVCMHWTKLRSAECSVAKTICIWIIDKKRSLMKFII